MSSSLPARARAADKRRRLETLERAVCDQEVTVEWLREIGGGVAFDTELLHCVTSGLKSATSVLRYLERQLAKARRSEITRARVAYDEACARILAAPTMKTTKETIDG